MNLFKKTLFVSLLALLPLSAKAQFHFGGQFNINFGNENTSYSSGKTTSKENAYIINLKPKAYWNIGEKMQVGGRVGFAFGNMTTGIIFDTEKAEITSIVDKAIGWSVSPFFGYRLLNWGKVTVWGEANAFIGQYYNTNKPSKGSTEWGKATEYGFQILPVINIDLNDKLALQLHLGFISLGWYGTREDYQDKVVTTSTWDLHKGGFSGIMQGLADYGIGLVKKF